MSELAHSIYDWLYRDLSLRTAGLIVGLLLIASHAYALFNYQTLRSLLRAAPRNKSLGTAILAIALVWVAEIVNTAFEHLCDVVQPDLHVSVKSAKDVAAGAVLVAAMAAAVIGGLVFLPYLAP